MRRSSQARWEQYQSLMKFVLEFLPSITTRSRGKIVLRELVWPKTEEKLETISEVFRFVTQDYLDNLVRRYLKLPTVQRSRRELDQMVKDIQAKANK